MEVKKNTQLIYSTIAIVFLSSILHTQAHMWQRQASAGDTNVPGTSKNIQEIFTGRCHEHLQCLQNDRCDQKMTRPTDVNCEQVWAVFNATVAYKNPCITPADAYDEVLKMAAPITPPDQTLFWSGLLGAAYNVARVSMHYRILEESLPGYIANGLTWCGDESPSGDGFNYTKCPSANTSNCANETSYTFWKAASREFANQATGDVSVALNGHKVDKDGNKVPSFQNTSTFASVELPNLDRDKVKKVQILVVPNITKPVNESEKCGKGSILILQKLIAQQGMNWTCEFDPLVFRYIQCTTLENPLDYAACRGEKDYTVAIIIGAVLGGVILLLIVILIVMAVKLAKQHRSPPYSRAPDGSATI